MFVSSLLYWTNMSRYYLALNSVKNYEDMLLKKENQAISTVHVSQVVFHLMSSWVLTGLQQQQQKNSPRGSVAPVCSCRFSLFQGQISPMPSWCVWNRPTNPRRPFNFPPSSAGELFSSRVKADSYKTDYWLFSSCLEVGSTTPEFIVEKMDFYRRDTVFIGVIPWECVGECCNSLETEAGRDGSSLMTEKQKR